MIEVKVIKDKKEEIELVERFLSKNEVSLIMDTDQQIAIIKEKNLILGIGSFNVIQNNIYISFIYVIPSMRNNRLGDALLRVMLNYGYVNNCNQAFVLPKDIHSLGFFKKEGFKNISLLKLSKDTYKDNFYFVNLEEFFNTKCCNNS